MSASQAENHSAPFRSRRAWGVYSHACSETELQLGFLSPSLASTCSDRLSLLRQVHTTWLCLIHLLIILKMHRRERCVGKEAGKIEPVQERAASSVWTGARGDLRVRAERGGLWVLQAWLTQLFLPCGGGVGRQVP